MDDNLVNLVCRAMHSAEPLIGSVSGAVLSRPTPCPALDLQQLTAHLVGGLRGFADVAEGKELRFDTDPDLSVEDPLTEFRRAGDRLLAAFSAPEKQARSYPMPWGATTGAQLLGFELIEVIVHGWDIARSLDTAAIFDDDVVRAALAGARLWVDDSTRTPQLFGPEVPVSSTAPALDQLVGFLGRDPSWQPSSSADG